MIIIEEHNEAYLEIVKFFEKMGKDKISLLHVDEHSDFFSPILSEKLLYSDELSDLKEMVYNELRISDWILPLYHKGIVSEVVWCSNEDKRYFDFDIDAIQLKEKIFLQPRMKENGNYSITKTNDTEDDLTFKSKNVVISIDLDYFSCNDEKGEEIKLELSKEEFLRYKKDKFHLLRGTYGNRATLEEVEGRYKLSIKNFIEAGKNKERTFDEISQKIDRLLQFFKRTKVQAREIILCKSVKSGYIDEKRASFLLNKLGKQLEEFLRTCSQSHF